MGYDLFDSRSISLISFPAALTTKTSFSAAYFNEDNTQSEWGENDLPKLKLIIDAPLSTAYLIARATSLSYSSPSGTVLIGIIDMLS